FCQVHVPGGNSIDIAARQICSLELSPNEVRVAEVRVAEVRLSEICPDEAHPNEVRPAEVHFVEVRRVEDRRLEIWPNLIISFSPLIPAFHPLEELGEVFTVGHKSPLFAHFYLYLMISPPLPLRRFPIRHAEPFEYLVLRYAGHLTSYFSLSRGSTLSIHS